MEVNKKTLDNIKAFFKKNPPPAIEMKLDNATVVKDPAKAVKTHIAICECYIELNKRLEQVEPYWDRLKKIGALTRKYNENKNQDNE